MSELIDNLRGYHLTWLASGAIAAAAIVIAGLANASRLVKRGVYRTGARATRIHLDEVRGPITVSVRPVDRNHVWIQVEGPADATVTDGDAGDSFVMSTKAIAPPSTRERLRRKPSVSASK